MVPNVQKYFNQISHTYISLNNSLLWRWQRGRESAAVDQLMGDVGGKKILDLGCGTGFYTRHFLAKGVGHVTAIDISSSMIEKLPKSKVTGLIGDAANIDLASTFSNIICAGLLEFVPDSKQVLVSARKLINEDGRMVCLLPPDNWAGKMYRAYHQRHKFEINLFRKADFSDICRQAKWSIKGHKFVSPYTDVYLLRPDSSV